MLIKKDFSYISDRDNKLIKMDYGKISVNAITFDRYYTEEDRERNRKLADSMNHDEWKKHCEEIQKDFGIMFNKIVEKFINSKYDIHQITCDTSDSDHFRSNWDLYYYSNEGWNDAEYMDFFRLDFNQNRSVEENLILLEELINFVEKLDYKNIYCRVQYTFIPNKKKINDKYLELCEKLQNKFIEYNGMIGKIKLIREMEDHKEYGFFKKRSKTKYYLMSPENLIVSECLNKSINL